MHQKHTNTIT